ncbi:hypothetical protein BJ878DRAFT_520450 [Calycina marina]|uniref:Uncharacterized protein n=1 Tax=Calycina marina TaxID=1763456 RepID=A0A9P8CC22_9HELO|nr:hypothetical protein BJ878DRAFT_520450 [Calycina marina]
MLVGNCAKAEPFRHSRPTGRLEPCMTQLINQAEREALMQSKKRKPTKGSRQPFGIFPPKPKYKEKKLQNNEPSQRPTEEETRRAQAAAWCLTGASLENIQIALQTKSHPDPLAVLSGWLHDKVDPFDYEASNRLSPHRSCDYEIKLGTAPSRRMAPCTTCQLRSSR